ncbi:hypothetical protein LTR20_008546 [Exophiala xenobiotica]|nr:hypothetical protein LTR40_001271 [Exophiala xenobiotica]KAK5384312.1 hypothetical protein LTS13_002506 [Exophiala xenobiotica]KAK5399368.1 hypothetical protein LTR79_003004 [Exophiala xenobiotica]KAK5416544.1 hypothetical protein LTR90_005766 [Exophiala xenobiotica]KAK5457800.1 hypothetical protein LTR20_008546 [Exophiala xenobiotica]
MLPDREATVGYAIDLLRAHQLRRENAFLHGEIQTCRKQLTSMQNELRQLSVIVQECRTDSAKAHSLRDLQAARFKEQTLEIDRLRYDYEKEKAEVSNGQAANEQALEHAKAEIKLLQRQVQQERVVCQRTTDTHQHHLDETNARVERLEVAIGAKAEKTVIEPLVGRLNHLAVSAILSGPRLDSVSLVRDSFEEENVAVQVENSQPEKLHGVAVPPPPNLYHAATKLAGQPTIPSDIDLDVNANTISYAGHQYYNVEENDSLRPLPEPQAQATQLAKVNVLRQMRFESWEHYYSQALNLIEALPDTFEEIIVRRYVEGIFRAAQRKHCQQWMDSKGWTWENIASFSDMCSQIHEAAQMDDISTTSVAAGYSEKIGKILQQREPKPKRKREATVDKRTVRGRPGSEVLPLRRSQRLINKERQNVTLVAAHSGVGTHLEPPALEARKNTQDLKSPKGKRIKRASSGEGRKSRLPETRHGMTSRAGHTEMQNGSSQCVPELSDNERQMQDTHGDGKEDVLHRALQPQIVAQHIRKVQQKSTLQQRLDRHPSQIRNEVFSVPRLVPQKRRLPGVVEDSSDDVPYLYRPPPKRTDGQELPTIRHKHSRRRLPLPPPPEIPILPTSSDE